MGWDRKLMLLKNRLQILIVLLTIGWQIQVRAQSNTHSNAPEVFYHQLAETLHNTPYSSVRDKAELLIAQLDSLRINGRFDLTIQTSIRQIVQSLRQKKVRTYPFLYDYLYNLNLLGESKLLTTDVLAWQKKVQQLIRDKQLNSFLDFMKFTRELLEKHILYKRANTAWYFRDGKYSIQFDTCFSLKFSQLNLVKASKNDSSTLLHTQGTYFIRGHLWQGEGGRLYWSRFYPDLKNVYAALETYRFKLSANTITIHNIVLKNASFLKQDVPGSVSDKVFSGKTNAHTPFPHFISATNNLVIDSIYPGVHFVGTIELAGKQYFGITKAHRKPELDFFYKKKTALHLRSNRFKFSPDKMEAAQVALTLPLEKDSVYHPDLQMRYVVSDKQLLLYTMASAGTQIPFFDSYHQLDLYVPSLFWDMHTDSLVFKKIRGVNSNLKVRFESTRYFSNQEFYRLQGIDELNPLYVIKNFTKDFSTHKISAQALAGYMRKPEEQAVDMLVNLSNHGFVVYNSETRKAIVKNRLDYFLNAKSGRTDYDVIRFASDVQNEVNASLNLRNLNLSIYGVPRIFISNSQHVYIYPYQKEIAVHKNRNFTFDGKVSAGLFNFYTHHSTFVYDSFLIRLPDVDSLTFSIVKTDSLHNRKYLIPIKNSLQKLKGRLIVDLPFNKSGQMHLPNFPEFINNGGGYVYFNRRNIQDSTLTPGRFYYRLAAFSFDSLMTFNTEGLAFSGQLFSDSIFPPIRSAIRVMPDYSLGFVYQAQSGGLPMYGGKGHFMNQISLSNKGFTGKGVLNLMTLNVRSKQFVFYPDSLLAKRAVNFEGKADSSRYNFPSIRCDSVSLSWDAAPDILKIKSLDRKFRLYGKAYFEGDLQINPGYMRGKGTFLFDQSTLISSKFNFTHQGLTADTADFYLKNKSKSDTTLIAANYFAKLDFNRQLGWFDHLDKQSFIRFPFNGYVTNLNQAKWLMSKGKLSLSSVNDVAYRAMDSLNQAGLVRFSQSGSKFIAVAPAQDSLQFYAGKAFYNIGTYTIDAEGVKLIKVADAAIFPKNGQVKILKQGKLSPLREASILADTSHLYHRILHASVNIQSGKNFTGRGIINYIDMNGTTQPIQLNKIFVQDGKTMATGNIARDEVFFLSPEYFFAGKVLMQSDHRFLRFQGGYQLNQECVNNVNHWIAFNQELNPKHIAFEIDSTTQATTGKKAYMGLAYSNSNFDFYPLVVQSLKSPYDEVTLSATGNLTYDAQAEAYETEAIQNLNHNDIRLSTKNCTLSGNGIFNLNLNTHLFQTKIVGQFNHFIGHDSTRFDVVLMLNFPFNDQALALMADSIRFLTVKSVNISEGLFPMAVKKLLNKQMANRLLNVLSVYGHIKKMPEALKSSITFTNLHLEWDKTSHSFLSSGPIGIATIGNKTLNKYVHGLIQIKKVRSGSRIHFLLKEGGQWYFFSYANGVLQVSSSDRNFNDLIKNQKQISNSGSMNNPFTVRIATPQKRINFIRNMQKTGY